LAFARSAFFSSTHLARRSVGLGLSFFKLPAGGRTIARSRVLPPAGPRRRWALLMRMRLPVAVLVAFQPPPLCVLSIRTLTTLSLTLAM
jgi:hypothetical protein